MAHSALNSQIQLLDALYIHHISSVISNMYTKIHDTPNVRKYPKKQRITFPAPLMLRSEGFYSLTSSLFIEPLV